MLPQHLDCAQWNWQHLVCWHEQTRQAKAILILHIITYQTTGFITILTLVQCLEVHHHPLVIFIILTMFSGLSGEKGDLEHRQDVFGSNTIPPKPPKTFLEVIIHSDSHYKTLDQIKDDFPRIFRFFPQWWPMSLFSWYGRPCKTSPSSSWRCWSFSFEILNKYAMSSTTFLKS